MIFIGVGANLPGPGRISPQETCEAALACFEAVGLKISARSRWFKSAPVPVSDQPWFINGVVAVETSLKPGDVMAELHKIEQQFGRNREKRNAARTLDLDLLVYDEEILEGSEEPGTLRLPHPRMHERAFVLLPLKDIAPDWRHPVLNRDLNDLIGVLDPAQITVPC